MSRSDSEGKSLSERFEHAFRMAEHKVKPVDPQDEMMRRVITTLATETPLFQMLPPKQQKRITEPSMTELRKLFAQFSHSRDSPISAHTKGTSAHTRETSPSQPLRETKDRAQPQPLEDDS